MQEFTGDDETDLFLEERETQLKKAQEDKRKIQMAVPGILNPHEIDDMEDWGFWNDLYWFGPSHIGLFFDGAAFVLAQFRFSLHLRNGVNTCRHMTKVLSDIVIVAVSYQILS